MKGFGFYHVASIQFRVVTEYVRGGKITLVGGSHFRCATTEKTKSGFLPFDESIKYLQPRSGQFQRSIFVDSSVPFWELAPRILKRFHDIDVKPVLRPALVVLPPLDDPALQVPGTETIQ